MARSYNGTSVWMDIEDAKTLTYQVELGGDHVVLKVDCVDMYVTVEGLELLADLAIDVRQDAVRVQSESARKHLAGARPSDG